MTINQSQIVVVLGMHRSGTSAMTRALQTMGVQLGERLLPAMEEVNAKGFWEDADLNALDVEMLASLGSDWFQLAPVSSADVQKLRDQGYFQRAAELLQEKTGNAANVFGFKDPRVAKLLPFWKEVFEHTRCQVSYVLALRHPLSVAHSLAKRDGIAVGQSYLLWLGHVITSLTGSAGDRRVLVDYDRLMQSPGHELNRMADRLGLAVDPEELHRYTTEFLDQELRHTLYGADDLQSDAACPPLVREIYLALLEVAADRVQIDDAALQQSVQRWAKEYDRLNSPLVLVDSLLSQKTSAVRALAERESQLAGLAQTLGDREGQVGNLTLALAEREERIGNLSKALDERDERLAEVNRTLADQGNLLAELTQTVNDRDGQVGKLTHVVAKRDKRIATLSKALEERNKRIAEHDRHARSLHDDQLANSSQALAERDQYLAALERTLAEREQTIQVLLKSRSWLITKPLRWLGRLLRGEFCAALDPLMRRSGEPPGEAARPEQPNPEPSDLPLAPIAPTHPVAVILPIYRDVEMTRRCILAAMPGVLDLPDARLLAINDASPDEDMQAMLEDLAKRWPEVFGVLRNETNLGFVRTVNRGIEHLAQHDVVLLNSDVVVPKDWLQRLRDEAYSLPDVGTVTPISNNATICSFPRFLQENPPPFDLDTESVDAVFRHFRLPCIEAPTGVGFCMYIRRACLDHTGLLDAEHFGRGYGEENDLCQRAMKKGWRNLITPNLYAYHEGGVSFSSDKQALVERAMRVIDELHPNYHADVQAFIKDDPLKPARVARHVQLLSTLAVPKVLHVSHNLGGGIGQHLDELAEYLGQRAVCLLLTSQDDEDTFNIRLGLEPHADQLLFRQQDYQTMLSLLKAAGVSAVHYHHTLGLRSQVNHLPDDLGVRHIMTVHDYYWLNANPTLTDENGSFSGYSDALNNPLYPLPPGHTPASWRESLRPLIEGAECVIFPSSAAKEIFNGHYRIARMIVAPHVETRRNVNAPTTVWAEKKNPVIGILGAIGREKGADYLEQIALLAQRLDKPYHFKLIGYAYKFLQAVDTTGPYRAQDLPALVRQQRCDLIFFPALCPETYSYTLSYALDSGLPIVAPRLGAFPERLSSRAHTMLYQPHLPAEVFLSELDSFIAALSAGELCLAPQWQGEEPQQGFYAQSYIDMLVADLHVANAADVEPIQVQRSHATIREAKRNRREIVLQVLWRCYMHPSMRWLGNLLPYGVRRKIKRLLSNRPMHDIVRS